MGPAHIEDKTAHVVECETFTAETQFYMLPYQVKPNYPRPVLLSINEYTTLVSVIE